MYFVLYEYTGVGCSFCDVGPNDASSTATTTTATTNVAYMSATTRTTPASPHLQHTVVLSTGEDGTLRIWDFDTGAALAVLRGHACHCIWRVDTITTTNCTDLSMKAAGVTVTGGNDGTVALYNIRDVIPISWWKQKEQPSVNTTTTTTTNHSLSRQLRGAWRPSTSVLYRTNNGI
jgi:WD40 repeat protein